MDILILNGPNLNLLGRREPEIYGSRSFEDYLQELRALFPADRLLYLQSNHEGALIDALHEYGFGKVQGIVLNAGGYTHTSVSLRDAVAAIEVPVVEVHISNIYAREDFRRHSLLADVCAESIVGQGLDGYRMAVSYLKASPQPSLEKEGEKE
ncbi:MAG: type II 3-dehydroquinate dehydratase [Paludibacteraceae bacterium]|nr:type II 3-dehydroquinate dehydratase [Paludibacteraceae bacterium]